MTTIKHRGTEPEGIAIADELGVAYDGIQEDIGYQFTDVTETGTTFYGNTLEKVKANLVEKRKLFGAKMPSSSEKKNAYGIDKIKISAIIV